MDTSAKARMERAAKHAKVPFKATELGAFLNVSKQTAHTWMNGTLPRGGALFEVADKLGVDPRWLATGDGGMLPRVESTGFMPHETELVARYRASDPRWQLSLRLLAALATEDQVDSAADLNVVIANIIEKKPADDAYGSVPKGENHHDVRIRRGEKTHTSWKKNAKSR